MLLGTTYECGLWLTCTRKGLNLEHKGCKIPSGILTKMGHAKPLCSSTTSPQQLSSKSWNVPWKFRRERNFSVLLLIHHSPTLLTSQFYMKSWQKYMNAFLACVCKKLWMGKEIQIRRIWEFVKSRDSLADSRKLSLQGQILFQITLEKVLRNVVRGEKES